MAKVKINNLKTVFEGIKKIFKESIERKDKLDQIKEFVVKRIQAETRKGFDLSRDGAPQPDLSDGYVRMRERFQETGEIDLDRKFFRPEKSNLTLTGQLLSSLNGTVSEKNRTIEVFVEGSRNDGTTNSKVAKDLADRGRTFLGLDEKGVTRIRKMVLDEIRKQIRLRK